MSEIVISPRSWDTFQHYKDRKPPWIKLHRGLLDDFAWHSLPLASRAIAPCIWLLASEYKGGQINITLAELAFRLRAPENEVREALIALIQAQFIVLEQDASGVLAECLPRDRGRGREEIEGEKEKEIPEGDKSPSGDGAQPDPPEVVDPPDGKSEEQSWFCRIQAILEAKAVRCKDFSPPVRADVVRNMAKNKPGLGNLILVLDELHAGGKIPEKPDDLAVELFVKALDEWPDVGWEGVFTNRAALYKKLHPGSGKGAGNVHELAGGRR